MLNYASTDEEQNNITFNAPYPVELGVESSMGKGELRNKPEKVLTWSDRVRLGTDLSSARHKTSIANTGVKTDVVLEKLIKQ